MINGEETFYGFHMLHFHVNIGYQGLVAFTGN
jgi:hypothetical protein